MLNELTNANTVRLYWVLGHEGIEGNKKADELARRDPTHFSEDQNQSSKLGQARAKEALDFPSPKKT